MTKVTKGRISEPPAWAIFLAPRACAAGPVGFIIDITLWTVLAILIIDAFCL